MRPHSVTNLCVLEIFESRVTILLEADMKQILFWIFLLALAALNWVALHDILKGEPNVWMEWTTVVASITLLVIWTGRRIMRNNK